MGYMLDIELEIDFKYLLEFKRPTALKKYIWLLNTF